MPGFSLEGYPFLIARDNQGIVVIDLKARAAYMLAIKNGQISQNLYGHGSILDIIENPNYQPSSLPKLPPASGPSQITRLPALKSTRDSPSRSPDRQNPPGGGSQASGPATIPKYYLSTIYQPTKSRSANSSFVCKIEITELLEEALKMLSQPAI